MNYQDFDFSVDLLQAILWQYNKAPKLYDLLNAKQTWYDNNQEAFWNSWYNDVFNLQTCNDFGCTVWAIILGIPLSIISTPAAPKKAFGFGSYSTLPGHSTPPTNALAWRSNFGRSNFNPNSGAAISLTLAQKRLVLQLRYYQLTSNCSLTETNQILMNVFGESGTIYLHDNLNMTVTLVSSFSIPSDVVFVLQEFDVIPRPAGVTLIITA